MKTLVLESPFNKVACLKSPNLIITRLKHRCFLVNIAKCFRSAFFIKHLWWLLLTRFRMILCVHGGSLLNHSDIVKMFWIGIPSNNVSLEKLLIFLGIFYIDMNFVGLLPSHWKFEVESDYYIYVRSLKCSDLVQPTNLTRTQKKISYTFLKKSFLWGCLRKPIIRPTDFLFLFIFY